MQSVTIGNRQLGPGKPVVIAAEVGINHNGDPALALECIDAAADCGADAVKFQNYHTEDFVTDRKLTYSYSSNGQIVTEPQYEMFKRCELTPGILAKLKERADKRGLLFHSTPTSESGIDILARLGVRVLKNGSDYLTNLPLIQAMGRTTLPTVLSTGMATLAEIDDAVRAFRETGNTSLLLLHCTSAYPTPASDVNLRKIPALAAAFDCPVGFSDHTDGVTAAVGAVALGACWIEKHFTLCKSAPGPDHHFSCDPIELAALVHAIRFTEKALGSSRIAPAASEQAGRRDFRLSCVAARPLPPGHRIGEGDLEYRRPGTGIAPNQRQLLVGRALRHQVDAGELLQLADVE